MNKLLLIAALALSGCWQQSNVVVTNNHAVERKVSAHLTVYEASAPVDHWITEGSGYIAPACAPLYLVVEACLAQAQEGEMASAAYRTAVNLTDEEMRISYAQEMVDYDHAFNQLILEGEAKCKTRAFIEEQWLEAQALRARIINADQVPSAACDEAVGQMPRRGEI